MSLARRLPHAAEVSSPSALAKPRAKHLRNSFATVHVITTAAHYDQAIRDNGQSSQSMARDRECARTAVDDDRTGARKLKVCDVRKGNKRVARQLFLQWYLEADAACRGEDIVETTGETDEELPR